MESFTEVTSTSWTSRIFSSIKGVLVGILLILASVILLWFNEGRAVKTAKGLKEGRGLVMNADANKKDASNDGKLIHISGRMESSENLQDELFGIEEKGILKLARAVEMYQWKEEVETKTKKKVGGGETTTKTYNYVETWSSSIEDSKRFEHPEGHSNPGQFPFDSYEKEVSSATIGSYSISPAQITQVYNYEPYRIDNIDSLAMEDARLLNDGETSIVYVGKGSLTQAQIGDLKVSFKTIPHGDYSIIAQQGQSTLEAFNTSYGTTINMVTSGLVSSDNMFETAEQNNIVLTWILRFVGFIICFIGVSMIFKPLVVVADVVPFLGNMLGLGLGFFSGIIAFVISFFVIAMAWIYYRPLLGFGLLALAIGVFVFFYMKTRKNEVGA